MAARSHLSGAALFLCSGAAVLTSDNRPAIRAVLWEGVPTLSDSDAKPPVAPTGRKSGGGKGGRGGRGSDVGDALKAAYNNTVREDVPQDLLDLLGKLD